MPDLTKDVQLGDYRYRISRIEARTGSWMLAEILTKMLPGGMEEQIGATNMAPARKEMTKREFFEIQNECLRVCARINTTGSQEVPEPVLRMNGNLNFPDLEKDVVTVTALTVHALVFNFSPFFDGSVLKPMLESFRDLIPFNALTK